MAVTCAKGHVNDDTNRFCDQCGLPLQAAPAEAPQEVTFVSMPAAGASSVVCPVCGQENVPGTAFCDNCGAELPPPQPALDQPAGAGAAPVVEAQAGAVTVVCPSCGTTNDAANRFCENCGASLSTDAAAAPEAAPAEGATVVPDAATAAAAAPAPLDSAPPAAAQVDSAPPPDLDSSAASPSPEAAVETAPAPAAGVDELANQPAVSEASVAEGPPALPDLPEAAPAVEEAAPAPAAEAAPAVEQAPAAEAVPAAEVSAPAAEAPAPAVDSGAERARLQGEIETQRRLVEQLEGMERSFGAATPPAIKQGLDEARSRLADLEQQLEQLGPEKPPVDPAEVARLEGEIETQRRLVEQLEGMERSFGAATPPAIKQGLDEARSALASAESELTALTGGAPAAPTPPAEFAPPAVETPQPVEAAAAPQAATPAPEASAALPGGPDGAAPVAVPVPEAAPVAPPAQVAPAAAGPRFVDRDGAVVSLASGAAELVIGREDPVSGIHPEVDLTPHGGEAGGVSRRHAVLREQGGTWTITDLDSTNYTRVDGARIAPNTPTPLHDGARVQFGRVEFEFHAS